LFIARGQLATNYKRKFPAEVLTTSAAVTARYLDHLTNDRAIAALPDPGQ
jgi:hypothetical protein